ncbi:MAG: amidase domain-containing protein [Bacilli bacterium]
MQALKAYYQRITDRIVYNFPLMEPQFVQWEARVTLKKIGFQERRVHLIGVTSEVNPIEQFKMGDRYVCTYDVQLTYYLEHERYRFVEECRETRRAVFKDGVLLTDDMCEVSELEATEALIPFRSKTTSYDRHQAVKYAERYWNDANRAFPYYENNCSNFVSQCLHAGGLAMYGKGDRNGWWANGNHTSLTWSTSHSLRWALTGKGTPFNAQTVKHAYELTAGDLIFYDFQGDGRFDHVTIVVDRDGDGNPLVNANTSNSRKRYWSYEDSTAYTPDMRYLFMKLI